MTRETPEEVDYRIRVIRSHGDVSVSEIQARLNTTIRVSVQAAPTFRSQLLALVLVELLARLFPRILIEVEADVTTHESIPGPRNLLALLQGARDRGHPPQDPEDPTINVIVGVASDEEPGGLTVHADALGWQSYVGESRSRLTDEDVLVAIGPLCAAARAAARVFQHALNGLLADPPAKGSLYISALNYAMSEDPVDEPAVDDVVAHELDALLVGAGSIGGAAIYALRYTPHVTGDLTVVDPQNLEARNYVRAILANYRDAQEERPKVEIACEALHDTALACHQQPVSISEYVASRPRADVLPLVLSAVDSIQSRRLIQDCLPLDLIDAACDQERAIVSGHVTNDGPCVYCKHIEYVLDGKATRIRLVAAATGFQVEQVAELLVAVGRTLAADEVSAIENHRQKPTGAYARFIGRPLAELYSEELIYGETLVGGGDVAVAAPAVTALAGFLLAGEALKAASPALQQFRLGVRGSLEAVGGGRAIRYEEPLFTPAGAILQTVPRSTEPACLCNSPRRTALLCERYGLMPT